MKGERRTRRKEEDTLLFRLGFLPDPLAALVHRLAEDRQLDGLRRRNLGCLAWMAEARQLDGRVGDLDADQPAALRQAEGFEVGEIVGRDRSRGVGGVA